MFVLLGLAECLFDTTSNDQKIADNMQFESAEAFIENSNEDETFYFYNFKPVFDPPDRWDRREDLVNWVISTRGYRDSVHYRVYTEAYSVSDKPEKYAEYGKNWPMYFQYLRWVR